MDSHYALWLHGDTPTYEGNDLSQLISQLNQAAPLNQGGKYYVSIDDGSQSHRGDNLVTNLQMHMAPGISVQRIDSQEPWRSVVLTRVAKVQGRPQIKRLSNGRFEGTQVVVQRAKDGFRQISLKVQASSRSLIVRFFSLFRNKFQNLSARKMTSVAEIVNAAKVEMKRKFRINDAALKTMVEDQTGTSYMVLLLDDSYAA